MYAADFRADYVVGKKVRLNHTSQSSLRSGVVYKRPLLSQHSLEAEHMWTHCI